jgi:hypothetical protein
VMIWLLLHMEHIGASCEFDEGFRFLVWLLLFFSLLLLLLLLLLFKSETIFR